MGQRASLSHPAFSLRGLWAYAGRAYAGQRIQHPNSPHVFLCRPASQPTWPAPSCHPYFIHLIHFPHKPNLSSM